MIEIIPAIIAKSFEELEQKINEIVPYTDWLQIDISDGIYTPNTTWNNPKELQNLKTKINLEIHLMISCPENQFEKWILQNVKRIIFHVDSKSGYEKVKEISETLKNKDIQFGIALNPEVTIEQVKNLITLADIVLLLGVTPGFSGQKFQPKTLEKIKKLRELFPGGIIEVDGGINPETAKQCIEAGASILVSGSYIFNSKNIKE